MLLDESTLRLHADDYRREAKLTPENGGSVSQLNFAQTAEIVSHLTEHTYFKIKDIIAYIAANYSITSSISGMERWLKKQNFSYHQPAIIPARADAAKPVAWVEHYTKLKNHLLEEDYIISHRIRRWCTPYPCRAPSLRLDQTWRAQTIVYQW